MPTEADYAHWIGRTRTATDTLSPRLTAQFAALLDGHLFDAPVPPGLFWCLAPEALPPDRLGRDGHPRLGEVLPDLPLPRRMWAGGEVTLQGDLSPGDSVTRTSVIEKIAFKDGASGPLGFVTLRNSYSAGGAVLIAERQDIVYRPDPAPGAVAAPPKPAGDPGPAIATDDFTPDPVMLFRFSALTFNGHRIHYDLPYATGTEGYAGLVVHGPLQAILLMNLASRVLGRPPRVFAYRGTAPLICGGTAVAEAFGAENGLSLRICDAGGTVTMTAQAA